MLSGRVTGQPLIDQQTLDKTQTQQDDADEALINELAIRDSSPIDPTAPASQAEFQPGKCSPELIADQAPKIKEILKMVAQHETFWRSRLRAYQSIQLPYETGGTGPRQASTQWTTSAWQKSLSHGKNNRRSTILTAFAIYLARLTGQTRLQIGYHLFQKQAAATSSLMHASIVPMEFNIEWDMSFSDVLEQTKQELQQLTQYSVFTQDLAHHDPILQEIPELQTAKPWRIGISMVDDTVNEQIIGAVLTLQIDERGQLRWLYDKNHLDAEVVDRMSEHLQEIIQAANSTHQKPVKQLNLLPKLERKLLLETWNATKAPYPSKTCIHQLFEKRVKRTPDATALVCEEQELSYAELNARANRLAHQLIALGVGPDARIALCVQRSPAMVVGLLAILKAGGAYVPLDPAYPSERLIHILTDAAPTILLADIAGRMALGSAIPSSIMVLDPNELPNSAITNPQVSKLRSDHLAYIIYTSGSTGVPKGVMMEHRAIVNLVESPDACFGAQLSSRILQLASLNFDVSIWEILIALNSGASLYLPPDIVRYDRNELWRYLAKHAITHAILPPALLQNGENLPNLGRPLTFILTGEASSATLLQNLTGHGVVFNAYGPTETHAVTVWPTELHRLNSGTVSIGRPIANTQLYLLDAHGQPVPLGAFGELYIGGIGVARGYLNRPELTAERFVLDPFREQEGARMYKTGDLARYLSDGNLDFLGRNDHQIKIRGFRVELGEIEVRLIEHPQVREAAVLALGDGNDKRLVAYVVAEADEQLASTLHTHLAAKLPDFMIPAAFVRLDALPLTPNRKLDRRALPIPSDEAFARQTYEAPQGEIEKLLAAIWAELLNVKQISRYDSFFALGGHSLLAIQMIERLHHHGLTVSIRALFDVPTLSILAQSIGQRRTVAAPPNLITVDTTTLTPAMLPLIDLSQADIDRIVEQTPGGVANIQDIYAPSPLQDGILFHHLLATKGDPYLLIAQIAFDNRALLDRYLDALQQVVNRHDILRTAFIWEGLSTSAQVVWRHAPLLIKELSLDSATGSISEQLLHHFNPRQHRIDLMQAPLLRLAIAQDENGRWLLVKLIHHLIGDQVTVELMDSEVQALMKGQSNTLLPPQPFRNLVAQARSGVSQEAYEGFFREMLAEVDEPTLPFGLTEIHRDGAQVTESHRMLPQELNDRLRAQARRLGVSLASLCHLAWAQVLARTSSQQRVVFGTVLLGRMQGGEGADRAMGLFINTLPLCVHLNDMGVEDSVRHTHARLASLLEYEHASLALAQRCSNVPAGTPLFSALLNYRHNTALSNDGLTEPGIEFLGAHERTNYPFTLSVEDGGHTLGLTAQVVAPYDPVRICGYMQQTLQSLVEALERTPDMPVYQLEALPRTERELLLNTWNATQQDYPSHLGVHQLFEAQVERAPKAIALVYEDQVLSYAELNAQANRLAHRLIELGVGPDKRVAICVERSPAMMVGLLAILKAGGVYVPLDPAYSSERLSYILTDAAPKMLLADAAGRAALGEATLSSITALDPNELPTLAITNPHIPELSSNRLAYVIYTSGSTGTPKGVMVEHRSIVNLARAQQAYFEIGSSSRVLQFISFGFDASIGEIFTALGSGASLYLPLDGVRRDRNELWDYFAKHAITHAAFPPALLQGDEDFPNLKTPLTLILGGEKPSPALLKALSSQGVIFNAYGPTEATVCTTAWCCPSDFNKEVVVPIGRPLANTQLYVLDANGQLAPMGAVGELYIGGAGVARGYLNRPELTAERFLPDPFREDEDARMYKTGDLVRYLPDGNLEYLGRNDNQIKIRGFRVEPGEIEACLIEHPQVREAVVLALGEESDKRLIAYVVAEADEQLAFTLRANLATRLPEYMLPAAFVRLDALPLTTNGKLDRRALPAPSDEAVARQAYEAPQGEVEKALAAIWTELLKVERISRYDSFFALGGHSLLAVQMIGRLRRLGLTVSVRVLFDKPTLKALAQSLGQHREVDIPPNLITIDTTTLTPAMLPLIDLSQADIDRIVEQTPGGVANIQDIYALSPLQDGILFHHLLATKGDPYLLIAQMSFDNRALLDRYLEALQQVVNRHHILRTAFIWEGLSTPAQVVWRHAPLSIEELSLDPAAGTFDEQLLRRFDLSQHRIDLTQAPLLRLAIAQDENGHWRLVELLHHLIGDHSTLEVLQSEIQAFLDDQGDMLAPPQPFRNLVAQARLGVSQEAYEHFFREMLAEVDEPTLPFGLAEVHRDGAQVTESHRMLSQELNDRLRTQARRLGQTLQSLVEALERTPDMPVYQLEALPRTERELLLNTWNATQQDYPSHLGVHQLFEAQVERAPKAIALVYEDQVLSYAELNAQANRLAHRLIELGVGPDKRVAICVERSPAMMVGLLAILKAGGAYVPLDPVYPSERLTHILIDAAPTMLLADATGRTVLGEAACASLTPAPIGAVGELYIGGAGVAHGYLNRPELTAERFLPDPFNEDKGARMYKTGDLARYLPDGNLEFLGRNDHQIKIRGFRIEPGEIEAHLIEHPQVREAVVLALGEGGDKRLVAYVVAEANEQIAATLRAYLTGRLPDYMMPAAFVCVDALPLTPNGKLDRRALPAPSDEAVAREVYEAPQGKIETMLAAIWSELLKVEQISRHDSFFALGGHSLLAVRLMNRITVLGVELPLATLFALPTLSAFAAAVNERLTQTNTFSPTIASVSREGVLPLSFAQQRLWFLAQLEGVNETYHIPLAIRLLGVLDRGAWQRALDTVFARHEALRSVFVMVEGQPQVQLLATESGLPMRYHDLRQYPNATEQVEHLGIEEARAPFDLAQGPLIRACLIQLTDEEHVFLLTQHHIVSDGWSLNVLQRELEALYAAYRAGGVSPLPPMDIQYPDYAAWQRQWLSDDRLKTQSEYWRATLDDAPVLLNLPTDRPRPAQQSFSGNRVPIQLDAQMTSALKQLSQKHGVTLFMNLLAGWGAVLSRLSGQDDIVIGTPSANRNHPEIEPLIGCFVNTLALRLDLSGEPNTVELFERLRHSTLAAQAHQDLPFEQVIGIVQPPRRLDHTPLFQVMFAWQNNEESKWHLPGLKVTPVDSNYDAVKFDLELELREVGDEIIGELGYATALFDWQTIDRHVGYLYAILRAMVSDAKQSLAQVNILAPAERKLLLETWSATQRDYPTHQCIHQLFETQVERTPEATAIVYENQELSYAELNARANRLAHRLIELGVGPDRRVAICMERSSAWVVGLLAILKAGGAYVPLDPAYPSERLTQILADAAPTILLADATGRSVLGEAVLALRTVLDPNSPPTLADTNPSVSSLAPHHLAYVVYTSGSTGTPKGVMVEHRGVVNLAHVQMTNFGVDVSSRILQFVSPGFDASMWEITMALGCGASLYLPPAAVRLDRHRLWDYLERHAITHATIPPALLQDGKDLPNLSTPVTLFLIGEALNATLLRSVRHHGLVFNGYGPTEATIGATVWPSPSDFNSEIVPIGRPMANIRLYLLDAHHQPVPVGTIGELYIGGVAVARGYLNRPELTAERFLQDPFSAEEDARMYKTGDRARYLPDGNLEFIGRNDYQIKMRGLRIEPGEIEARLVEHSKVREAAVLAVGEGSHKRLIAYVVAETDEQLAATLHTHLMEKLPEYMVPAAFVRLDALPLTSNGKLDRRALPTPDGEAFARQAFEAPQGEIETALANIWSKLLKVERISRHDSFFVLGGHSLLAVQMIESLRRLGLAVSVRALFDKPTLKALAQSLGQHQEIVIPPNLITTNIIALTPAMLPLIDLSQAEIDQIIEQTPGGVANIQDIYALSPLQDGILFHHVLATEGDPYLLIAQMIFANRESLNRYLYAVQQVINRHDILRTAFVWDKLSTPAQVVWRHAPLSITELSLDIADGPIAEQLSQRFDPRHHRLNLTQAPLFQFIIAQDSDGRWQMVQLLHHLTGDHSTLEEMQREIQAFLEGQGDTLSVPQPFRNLVAQARLGVSQEAHDRFFKEMLAEVDEPTLPFGLSEVYRDGTQVTESHRMLPQELNDRLRAQARRLNVSLASLCHLAWAQVLARTSGQQRVVFGTVLFGRMQAGEGADRALGLFINTLPLRIDVDRCSVQEGVRDTQTRLAALLEHEHASLALAQRCSGVPAGVPLFSALLNYRHQGMQNEGQISVDAELLRAEERDNYPIGLSIEDFGQALGLTASIAQPFDAKRVCGYMHQAMQSLADALEHTPDKPVYQLEVLPPSEQELLLNTWNTTAIPYPEHQCLHWLFEEQVERTPDAVALVRDNQTVSYAELNAQANRLARYLRDLGVQPDSRVALLVQSSIEAVIAMLAVIKAGGAYVPLDPDYPPERLVDMVTDCAPVALLSIGEPHAAVVQCLGTQVPILGLQADATQWTHYSSRNLDSNEFALNAEHLAYVIYTSGSTGRPKGVMVEHRNVVNDVTAAAKLLDFSSQDRMLQFASLSFDVSVEEIFLTLTRGATLVLRTDAWVTGAEQFWSLCEANQISVVDLPTPFWAQLVQEQVAIPGCVRTIYAGGDAFSASAAHQAWFTGTGYRPRLLNGYGLTETSITNTAHDVTADDSHWRTIGRPLANTRLYILDPLMQPAPLGIEGELYIGGAGVARGYLNRPELTKERFLLDPFSDQVNARMYKTGDLVRYLPNGNLEFLGRNDHQVKIRGFRIELSEIEARLAEHSLVSEAVVLALGDGSDKRLVAYVVAKADEQLVYTL
ncbi:hypothetical protein BGZ97_009763, partial [Linnemannia gamsii]